MSTNRVTGQGISAPVILSPMLSGTNLVFSVATVSGKTYRIEYKDSLDAPFWQLVQTLTGDGTLQTVTNPTGTSSQRFFRLVGQ